MSEDIGDFIYIKEEPIEVYSCEDQISDDEANFSEDNLPHQQQVNEMAERPEENAITHEIVAIEEQAKLMEYYLTASQMGNGLAGRCKSKAQMKKKLASGEGDTVEDIAESLTTVEPSRLPVISNVHSLSSEASTSLPRRSMRLRSSSQTVMNGEAKKPGKKVQIKQEPVSEEEEEEEDGKEEKITTYSLAGAQIKELADRPKGKVQIKQELVSEEEDMVEDITDSQATDELSTLPVITHVQSLSCDVSTSPPERALQRLSFSEQVVQQVKIEPLDDASPGKRRKTLSLMNGTAGRPQEKVQIKQEPVSEEEDVEEGISHSLATTEPSRLPVITNVQSLSSQVFTSSPQRASLRMPFSQQVVKVKTEPADEASPEQRRKNGSLMNGIAERPKEKVQIRQEVVSEDEMEIIADSSETAEPSELLLITNVHSLSSQVSTSSHQRATEKLSTSQQAMNGIAERPREKVQIKQEVVSEEDEMEIIADSSETAEPSELLLITNGHSLSSQVSTSSRRRATGKLSTSQQAMNGIAERSKGKVKIKQEVVSEEDEMEIIADSSATAEPSELLLITNGHSLSSQVSTSSRQRATGKLSTSQQAVKVKTEPVDEDSPRERRKSEFLVKVKTEPVNEASSGQSRRNKSSVKVKTEPEGEGSSGQRRRRASAVKVKTEPEGEGSSGQRRRRASANLRNPSTSGTMDSGERFYDAHQRMLNENSAELAAVQRFLATLRQPIDEDQIYGDNIACELRALRCPVIKRYCKCAISQALINAHRDDAVNLQEDEEST